MNDYLPLFEIIDLKNRKEEINKKREPTRNIGATVVAAL